MERSQKKQLVSSMSSDLSKSESVIVVHYKGLNVAEITDLRNKVRQEGACFKVVKNSLMRLALVDSEFDKLTSLCSGPTAFAYSNDPVAAARAISKYADSNGKLVVLGGVVCDHFINAKEVKDIASLPSLDELRAKIIGVISAPATKLATVLQAPASQVARVLSAYAEK